MIIGVGVALCVTGDGVADAVSDMVGVDVNVTDGSLAHKGS